MLRNISIVLVEPQGDENVGMVARAMKNSAITDLRLVNPRPYKTKPAYKWACNSADILDKAKIFKTLKESLDDISMVIGLSRRAGKLRPPRLTFKELVSKVYSRSKKGKVALVFGREDDGLQKSELSICDFVCSISTSKSCPSLNLAQAVMLTANAIFQKFAISGDCKAKTELFVPKSELLPVIKELETILLQLGYDNKDDGKLRRKIIKEFEEIFGRAGLRRKDVNMFLGLFTRIKREE